MSGYGQRWSQWQLKSRLVETEVSLCRRMRLGSGDVDQFLYGYLGRRRSNGSVQMLRGLNAGQGHDYSGF